MRLNEGPFSEQFPIVDAIDHDILMHRDAHFGGKFSVMLDYYKREGRGCQPEFKVSRIEQLAVIETELKENLSALFLVAHEIQKVADARSSYQKLRSIYEIERPRTHYPRLIADLILTEEDDPEAEIGAIVQEKGAIVPSLIELLKSEEIYDPLFPGYGQTPLFIADCLGRIGDKKAIVSLFEAIGQGDFFADDQMIRALKAVGAPARDFLLKVLKSSPINEDNERAAIALISFKDEEEVANCCLDLLKREDVKKDPSLPTYLVLACAGLKDPFKRQALIDMSKDSALSSVLRHDIKAVIDEWNKALSSAL